MGFFVTLYIPFGFFYMVFFTFTSRARGFHVAQDWLEVSSCSWVLAVTFICIKSLWVFLFILFYRKVFFMYIHRSLFMQTRAVWFDLIPPQMLMQITFWLYSCHHFEWKWYILVGWRMNLLIEDLAIKKKKQLKAEI